MECIHQFVIVDGQEVHSANYTPPCGNTILYEVIRVTDGTFLFLNDHLDRLFYTAKLADVDLPLSGDEIKEQLERLVFINHAGTGNIQIIFQYELNQLIHYAFFFRPHSYPSAKDYRQGVKTILFEARRENPNAKIVQQSLRDRINEAISEKKAYEAILVHPEGYITEGSRSNFFMIKDGVVYTAPEIDVLSGITRKYISEVCRDLSIPLIEKRVTVKELGDMQAAFISGTSPKVLPVSEMEQYSFDPQNDILRKIMVRYDEVAGLR